MKTTRLLTFALAAWIAAVFSTASAVTITYYADDIDSFDVLIEDVGDVGIDGPAFSPSGIWSFGWQVEDVGGFPTVAEVAAMVQRSTYPPFTFVEPFGAPNFYDVSELPLLGTDTYGTDTIDGVFAVSSGTNLDDWAWSFRLTLREDGPPPTSVPDGASTALLLLVAGLGLAGLRKLARVQGGGVA